jgi:ice-binding like protein/Big-like domain-containing protein
MKISNAYHRCLGRCVTALLFTLAAGCSGDSILGAADRVGAAPTAPVVTTVSPADNTISVPINGTVAVTFNKVMAAGSTFAITCAAPCTNPTGTVALGSGGTVATYTLTPATSFEPLTQYTVTATSPMSAAGIALAAPFVSHFITAGVTADTNRPRVLVTSPLTTAPGPTPGAPTNAAVIAVFSKDMDAASIEALGPDTMTVTCALPCTAPAGVVSYSADSRTAIFTPTLPLAAAQTYTVRITTAAQDLTGNSLAGNQAALPAASDYVWTFTTGAVAGSGAITVLSTNPASAATGVCPNGTVNGTFNVPSGLRLDPLTVNAVNFTVTGPAPGFVPVTAATILVDSATGHIATFTPAAPLAANTTYSATLEGGVTGIQDLAVPANGLAADSTWTFTTGATNCLTPVAVPLSTVAPYGTFGGSAGMTNSGIFSVVNGDIGTIATSSSSITGFHDTAGDVYTESIGANVGAVNGTIYTCTNSTTGPTSAAPNAVKCAIATQARLDAQTAYLQLAGLPPGANPGANLAALTLAPGVYTAPGGSFLIEGGDLTLDAQGDANAVFVFQMAQTLTVGGPGVAAPQSIVLAGGAQAKNVYWQVGSFATINAAGGGTMVGTILSQAGVSFSTAGNVGLVTLNGRALSLGASVTMVNTVINVPAP